ncbi:hypothetical protein SEVIR_9G282151v4 [Setaria viridis]|uniref:Uncharacterized protein n=1 Tax=Setaria viridis TaxID=4556 RepID=A0A4U6SYY4_SETVI|nr:tuliposide A-converting enzyme b2, amyloplastic-like [Setaria viridis]TKV94260.1 hypothetical protein SEVIR_9G282151v2 [Setaria viridis]
MIDPANDVSVRLYLPPAAAGGKLPVVMYFHGGGFMVESAASVRYHRYLNTLAARAGAVAVDDQRLSSASAVAPPLALLPTARLLVAVAGVDFLATKGRAYHAALLACGWRGEAELEDTPGVDHVFHLMRPGTEAAEKLMDRVVAFIARA